MISLTQVWAGPLAARLMADFGAEVIKVESRQRTDMVRTLSMTTVQRFDNVDASPVFNEINLNKLSIRLNLSQPKAIEIAKKLVSLSDVVAQNMRP